LPGARAYFQQALQMTTATGYRRSRGYALMGLSEVQIAAGEFAAAHASLNEALAIRQGLNDEGKIASSRLGLGELALEEGHAAEAADILREAAGVFRKNKSTDEECEANANLARALFESNRTAEALQAIQKARELQKASSFYAMNFLVTAAEAQVLLAARPSSAGEIRARLQSALNDTNRHGYQGFSYQLRLALGQLDLKTGRAAQGRANLDALASETRAKGFDVIAHRAQQSN